MPFLDAVKLINISFNYQILRLKQSHRFRSLFLCCRCSYYFFKLSSNLLVGLRHGSVVLYCATNKPDGNSPEGCMISLAVWFLPFDNLKSFLFLFRASRRRCFCKHECHEVLPRVVCPLLHRSSSYLSLSLS